MDREHPSALITSFAETNIFKASTRVIAGPDAIDGPARELRLGAGSSNGHEQKSSTVRSSLQASSSEPPAKREKAAHSSMRCLATCCLQYVRIRSRSSGRSLSVSSRTFREKKAETIASSIKRSLDDGSGPRSACSNSSRAARLGVTSLPRF